MLRKLGQESCHSHFKQQVYKGLVPYKPFDPETAEQASRTTRWDILFSDVGVGCYSFFLMYSMFVVSLDFTVTDLKALGIK